MRVLIADKIPSMRSALKLVLSQFKEIDYIAELDSEENLLDKIASYRPDIVLIDCVFFGSRTKETIISIKAKYPGLSVVVLGINSSLRDKYLKADIDDFIVKGYPPDRLYNAMKYLINKNKDKKTKTGMN